MKQISSESDNKNIQSFSSVNSNPLPAGSKESSESFNEAQSLNSDKKEKDDDASSYSSEKIS